MTDLQLEELEWSEEDSLYDHEDAVVWVYDPERGRQLPIERDGFYISEMARFHNSECPHATYRWMKVFLQNGAFQVRECCPDCGNPKGLARKQDDRVWVASLPVLPPELAEDYQKRRDTQKLELHLFIARRQLEERGRFSTDYTAYYQSEPWKARRDLVLKRCGCVCEGCGTAPAVDIHHMSYDNFKNEFLFELVGLCKNCHDRWHEAKERRRQRLIASRPS